MPDPGHPLLLHVATLLSAVAGMGWLALAMEVHARQAWGHLPGRAVTGVLRVLGGLGLGGGLLFALGADHPSMAVLVWVMAMAGAALTVALILAWRPHWLRVLAPWVHPPRAGEQPPDTSPGGADQGRSVD